MLVNEWGTAARVEAGESQLPYPDVDELGWPGAGHADLVRTADLLHPVFAAATPDERVDRLDRLLVDASVSVRVDVSEGHVEDRWVAARPADRLLVAALRTIREVLAERGADAIGTCADDQCVDVWIDGPRGRPRRYCSDYCSSRARVAAYRRRQREERA